MWKLWVLIKVASYKLLDSVYRVLPTKIRFWMDESGLENDTWDLRQYLWSLCHHPPSLPLPLDSWDSLALTQYIYCKYHLLCNIWSLLCSFLWSLSVYDHCRQMSRLGQVTRQYRGSLNKCGPGPWSSWSPIVSLVSDLCCDVMTSGPGAF